MAAQHLRVDLSAVDRLASRLSTLADQFTDSTALQREGHGVFGPSSELARAVDEVSENWEINRRALAERIRAVSDMAAGTVETLTQVDQELAQCVARSAERQLR